MNKDEPARSAGEEIICREVSLPETIRNAKSAFLSGRIDPLQAWANMSRFKRIVENLQSDSKVRDYALEELSKHGTEYTLADCRMEEAEAGVKYDYSVCCDNTLNDLYTQREALEREIKEREAMLKCIPEGKTIADTTTGEELRRPVRTSKTIIKVTFKK